MKNCLYCIDVYTVSEGDTLYSIAEKYELPVSLLMKVNGIENPYNLQIGTRLCIPGTADQRPRRKAARKNIPSKLETPCT